ncbi:hypothetical protein MIR68_008760 [Amoeboaphelidium protococcarum]|nr:hypothetical protein MIR68_008760 [Amoeboaphelidium protococcarum]
MSTEKIKCGILGATGMVGQRFIQLLESHPWFEVGAVGASFKSAGMPYVEACKQWKLDTSIPAQVASLQVQLCEPQNFTGCRVIFSGLDSDVAGEIEQEFRRSGFAVFSNAKSHRMDELVPLAVPLVNPQHMQMVKHQQAVLQLQNCGFIVTNANCSSTGLVVPLKALHDAYGLQQVHVCTMQAISGAGYPGVSAMDIVGNVIPYIGDEEHKIETEPLKILGELSGNKFIDQKIMIDAVCHRVPVIDGHTETVSIKFLKPPKDINEVSKVLREYKCEAQSLNLPSAPEKCIIVRDESNRPQPRLDLMNERGFAVTVGRLRKGNYWELTFTLLSHNTILGAAGSAIMNAEYAQKKGLL